MLNLTLFSIIFQIMWKNKIKYKLQNKNLKDKHFQY